jgi:N-glycosylase/DNA lyase
MAVRRTTDTAAPRWSQWEPLDLPHRFTADSLRETLDGGQAFRWRWREDHAAWQGIFADHAVQLRLGVTSTIRDQDRIAAAPPLRTGNDDRGHPAPTLPLRATTDPTGLRPAIDRAGAATALQFRTATDPARARTALLHYLGMAAELDATLARLPLTSDAVLATAVANCSGLILLRQPFAETLLEFILSSTKRIPQIRQLCETLASRFGADLAPGLRALPTWERLATVGERELRACALGFRATYVHETAQFLAAHPGWLDRVETSPYAEAKVALCELPGVGAKVADCALLFGASRLEAFPVDVWILRTLAENYGLVGWRPAQLTQFGRVHFGPCAGLAQQYLFAAARRSVPLLPRTKR